MKCPRCQQENPTEAKFCNGCGGRLEIICDACSHTNPIASRFCNECGHPLGAPTIPSTFGPPQSYTPQHLSEKILASKGALEGERKQVTVLFADMKGSMELLADRDPEEARKILDPVLEQMMDAVHRYEGTVNQVMGDGIMALFGAPLSHEDHAVRACYAALKMQETVKQYAEGVRRAEGIPIQIRVGLNSGEVVVRSIGSDLKMDYTAVGQTTNLAARMEQMATPGSSLATADALRLAEGYVQVNPLGPVHVKGLSEPIEVFEVTGAGPARSRLEVAAVRGLTRFVGRDAEIETLRQALEPAQSGHGQVVAVVGEAGVGKSRLFWEFTQSHRAQGWLNLKSSSVSYGKATAYFPIIDLLKGYFKVQDREGHREIREKITGKLLTLDEALRPTLLAFLQLLDVPVDDPECQVMDPPQRRRRTLDAVKRLLLRESQVQPLLLVFEDLHWIDSETQALLDTLIESLPTARILLLVNYRPEYQHTWGNKTYYTQLRLDPLPPESAEELLQALLGDDPDCRPLKQLLTDRTEGNPFFIEESVRTLVEMQVLIGEQGAYRLVEPLESIQVPVTVQAVLAARIDRLPVDEKRLLQSAAVIGERVPFSLLEAIAELPAEAVHRGLTHLQAAEFLYETSLFPDLEYTFKHGLTCQVAYGSLLYERRRALHAAIVEAIERLYQDRLSEQVELLAHHASRGEVWKKAVAYLHQAGAKAAARSAYREAVAFFKQAILALSHLPENKETLTEAMNIRVELGPALMATLGYAAPEVESSYNSARELCERFGEPRQLFPTLWGLWLLNQSRGQHETAQALGERLLTVAEREQDNSLQLQAHHALWTTLFNIGELAAAEKHLQRGLALYNPERHRSQAFMYGGHDPGVCCRNHRAWTRWMLGYPDQALESAQAALKLAGELSHPFSLAHAHSYATWIYWQRGEWQDAAHHAKATLELASDQGFSLYFAYTSAFLGRLAFEEGHVEEGIAQLHTALAGIKPRMTGRAILFVFLLADAYRKTGRIEEGLEALATAEQNLMPCYKPELFRLKGELLLRQAAPAVDDAEVCFSGAIEAARRCQEKSLELRAVMCLSRLWHKQGKQQEARELLAGIYNWFTEGFGTADLKEAKALLKVLS